MRKAAIYVRQSLDRDGGGLAVARQEKECRALCKRLGLSVGEVYADNDTSATSGVERPAFERLLADRPAAIVAWHQDRLLRLTRDLERVIELDVPVYTVSAGTLDLTNPAGRAVARTVATWSQYETEQKAERQKAAHRQRAAAGKPWTTRRPFGFEADAVTHRPDEVAAIRGMYADLLAGTSQAEIARGLNQRGILSSLGKPWRQSTVRALLLNPRNAGLRAHNGTIVGPGEWEPVVPEATWHAAAGVMASDGRRPGGARKYLLTGLARCGVCGSPVRTTTSVRGARHYSCPNFHVGRDAEQVDAQVTALMLGRLAMPDAVDLLASDRAEDVAALQAEADDARRTLDTMAEMFGAGQLTASAFRAGSEKAAARLAEIEARMARSADGDAVAALVQAEDVEAAWDALTLPRQRQVIEALVTIEIDRTVKGGRYRPEDVRVTWRGQR